MRRTAGPLKVVLVMAGLVTLGACTQGLSGPAEPVTVTLEHGQGHDTLVFDAGSTPATIGEGRPVRIDGLGLQVNDPAHCAPVESHLECHFGTVQPDHPYALPISGQVQFVTGWYTRAGQATEFPLAWP